MFINNYRIEEIKLLEKVERTRKEKLKIKCFLLFILTEYTRKK